MSITRILLNISIKRQFLYTIHASKVCNYIIFTLQVWRIKAARVSTFPYIVRIGVVFIKFWLILVIYSEELNSCNYTHVGSGARITAQT